MNVIKEGISINALCMKNTGKHIVIIGNGISGITCARNVRKLSDYRITVISAESEHFFSRTALMYIYLGHMKFEHTKPYENSFWAKNRIELLTKIVDNVNVSEKTVEFHDGSSLNYDVLVIATGSKSNKFGWPGQNAKGVQGFYSLDDLKQLEANTAGISNAVIVGGGLIGIEMAEMLLSRNIEVTFLVRERNFWDLVLPLEEAKMINRHIREHHIDLRLETELKEIKTTTTGFVQYVVTSNDENIECQFVGLTVGVSPNIDFLKDSGIELQRGVLVNEFFETNISCVFAIGDCAQFRSALPGRKPIEQVWYTGRMHGETLAKTICGLRTPYSPGTWFNSAKFFDIEYQTYGTVNAQIQENEQTFYWEHPGGKISLRVNYEKGSNKIIGINALGLRLRHQVIARWLKEGKTLQYLIEHLGDINFDPEFTHKYEYDIVEQFNRDFKVQIKPAVKSWSRILNFK